MIPPRIFISYRRDDTGAIAHLLREQLLGAMPPSEHREAAVFLDVRSIEDGREFPLDLAFAIEHCRLVVVLIGPRWLSELRDRQGGVDWVRSEIEQAIKFQKYIVPIWIDCPESERPTQKNLPLSMARLAFLNAIEVNGIVADLGALEFCGPTLGPSVCQRLLRLEAQQQPPGIEANLAVHALDDALLLQEMNAINETVAAADTSWTRAGKKKLLSKAVSRACQFIDRRSRCFDTFLALLREYPARQTEVVRAFLGKPNLLAEFFLAMQQAYGKTAKDDWESIRGFEALQTDILRIIEKPPLADDFTRAWKTLQTMVCDTGANLSSSKATKISGAHMASSFRAAASCAYLAGASEIDLAARFGFDEPDVARVALSVVAGRGFIDSVRDLDDGVSLTRSAAPASPRRCWASPDKEIDLMSALKSCCGSSAEAELTRRALAEELADAVLREANVSYDDLAPVHSELALLFGDSRPDWGFAPKWVKEDGKEFRRYVAEILHGGHVGDITARTLMAYSEQIGFREFDVDHGHSGDCQTTDAESAW